MAMAKSRIVVTLAILPMLGGCKAIFGSTLFGHLKRPSEPVIEQASAIPDAATQEGRQQLASGNPGLAIAAFQQALATGEAIAPAANGLGVAYARIGRGDLAQRFFEEAIASAPDEPKYIANLDRLIAANQLDFAYRNAMASAKLARLSPPTEQLELPSPQSGEAAGTETAAERPMRRISRAEVLVTTVAPAGAASVGRKVERGSNFRPVVRLAIGRDKIANFHPVVRFQLPASEPSKDVEARSVQTGDDTAS